MHGAGIVICFIAPGEMFGTVALFTDQTYPAGAVTLTKAAEASWSKTEVPELIWRHSPIAIKSRL